MEQDPWGQFAGILDCMELDHRRSHDPEAVGPRASCSCWAGFLEAVNCLENSFPVFLR